MPQLQNGDGRVCSGPRNDFRLSTLENGQKQRLRQHKWDTDMGAAHHIPSPGKKILV